MSDLKFFTLGYQLRDLSEFISELQDAQVDLVVDVRETPWSRKKGFSKTALRDGLAQANIGYLHARFAGNPKELRRSAVDHQDCLEKYEDYLERSPAVLEQLTELVREGVGDARRICFICYERHPADCHRKILLERWRRDRRTAIPVRHLAPGGAPRIAEA